MKFLCTSDLHLGRCSSIPSDPLDLDVSAQGALNRLVKAANRNRVDWLLIAGDLSDRDENYYASLNALREAFLGLDSGIRVAMISGNHDEDTLERIAASLRKTPGLEGRILYLNGKEQIGDGLYLTGRPYDSGAPGAAGKALLEECGSDTIVLFHGDHKSAGGKYSGLTGEERERLARNTYFTVCGHNHYPDRSFFDPDRGERFVSCGSPQALDAGDGGASGAVHGAWLIEGRDRIEFIPLSTVVYATERIDVNDDLEAAVSEREAGLLEEVRYKACVVADIILTGRPADSKSKPGKNKLGDPKKQEIRFGNTLVRTAEDETLPDVGTGDASPLTLLNSLLTRDGRFEDLRQEIYTEARARAEEITDLLKTYDAGVTDAEYETLFDDAVTELLKEIIKENGRG